MFYQMKLSLLKQTIQAFVKAQISIIVFIPIQSCKFLLLIYVALNYIFTLNFI